ncbi:MAG TPA: filamentous hemagglutinin N-terminal domain-containing protein, partial [Allocoleopsis sp.]
MRLFWYLAVTGAVVLWMDDALAQRHPIADDTLGNERSIVTPEDNIRGRPGDRIEGGARRGDNLFHSFQEFNIEARRAVYFDDPGVINILSRVTGGNVSDIQGTLGVLGDANLFLINPSGIIFGPGARLDVGGSFMATTADSFVFENGFAFSATNPQAPPFLTVSVPIGLQYGTQTPGAIVNQGSLNVNSGQSLILAGGEITLDNGRLDARNLLGGRIELGSVSGTGTVELEQSGSILSLSIPQALARSDVRIINGSVIDARAGDGGSISVTAQKLDILGRNLIATGIGREQGTANSQAGDIVLDATDTITVGTSLIANVVLSNAIGDAGNLRITAGALIVEGSQFQTRTLGQGDAGDVIISARNQVLFDDGTVLSRVEEGAI